MSLIQRNGVKPVIFLNSMYNVSRLKMKLISTLTKPECIHSVLKIYR